MHGAQEPHRVIAVERQEDCHLTAFLARVLAALFGGLLFSQSAEFTQQYLQRLGGAADEMEVVVERFEESARAGGLAPEAAIERLKQNADDVAARQGTDAAANRERYAALERRYRALLATTPLFRPFEIAIDPDWPIAGRAAEDYRPAIPATGDALVLAVAGFVLGWGCGGGAHGAVAMAKRRREKRTSTPEAKADIIA